MRVGKKNPGLIFLGLTMTALLLNHAADAAVNPNNGGPIDFRDLDPCKKPGGPHLGCAPPPPPRESNPYHRGCNPINRCRIGPPPS
ncbi:hypothetical protein U1Q18_020516 [Sarracenia purpurea var. burkii]